MSVGVIEPLELETPANGLYVDPRFVPNVEPLITEDDTPMDNMIQAAQQRLLVESLYSSWTGPGDDRTWLALSNVGLFFTALDRPMVPDVMVSLDVVPDLDRRQKENRSYFVWVLGKMPDLVMEIVSNKEGKEDTDKLREYSRHRIPYYVIYDPMRLLSSDSLRVFSMEGAQYVQRTSTTFPEMNLGLVPLIGAYEGVEEEWLRWTDRNGAIVRTGAERAIRSDRRADRLAEMVRQMGGNPDAP